MFAAITCALNLGININAIVPVYAAVCTSHHNLFTVSYGRKSTVSYTTFHYLRLPAS
ncbi:hypothetical protein JB92DRAFT_1707813 [Gautieria morchelliformis]|nr:hypothetical protein JB92DRAFT_1707813 [Gautieria morchelliformis]